MFRDARLVAAKDLRVELRSRVAMSQVAPFAVLVLVLFAFALDPERDVLRRATPGLFWVTVMLSALLSIQRAFAVESTDGIRDQLRLSGMEPGGIFLGKFVGIAAELLVLETLLVGGVVLLYNARLVAIGLLVATAVVATLGIAAAGTLYGALVSGVRGRETLLPLLLLPVLAPVLIGASAAFDVALGGPDGTMADGWRWLALLVVFALVYLAAGILAYGPLLEES